MISNPDFLPDENIQLCAIEVLKNHDFNSNLPVCPLKIIEMNDFEFNFSYELPNDRPGYSENYNDYDSSIYINANIFGEDIEKIKENKSLWHFFKFTAAHELGHCFIKQHRNEPLQKQLLNDSNAHKNRYTMIKENQANKFAAELLMPSNLIKKYLDYKNNPLAKAQDISEVFDVSLTASFLRLANLSSNIAVCMQVNSKTGKIEKVEYSKSWEKTRYDYRPYNVLYIKSGDYIPDKSATLRTLKDNSFSGHGKKNSGSITNWFSTFSGDEDLYEWPYILGNKIITFIEVEQPKDLWSLAL